MTRTPIQTPLGPAAIGPYSQAVRSGEMIFVSGQIALDAATGAFIEDRSIHAQTRQALENMKGILAGAGATLEDVVQVTIYVTDLSHFNEVNDVYGRYFQTEPPARATVQVAALPLGAAIEVDCIAVMHP